MKARLSPHAGQRAADTKQCPVLASSRFVPRTAPCAIGIDVWSGPNCVPRSCGLVGCVHLHQRVGPKYPRTIQKIWRARAPPSSVLVLLPLCFNEFCTDRVNALCPSTAGSIPARTRRPPACSRLQTAPWSTSAASRSPPAPPPSPHARRCSSCPWPQPLPSRCSEPAAFRPGTHTSCETAARVADVCRERTHLTEVRHASRVCPYPA